MRNWITRVSFLLVLGFALGRTAQSQTCQDACWADYNQCMKSADTRSTCPPNLNACLAHCTQPPPCPDPLAVLPPPRSITATTAPSSSGVAQVNLSWSPVPGADAYEIYREQSQVMDYHNPSISLGHISGPALAVPLQPGSSSSAAVPSLPFFYPVDFLISTIKNVVGPDGSTVACEGSFTRSNTVVPVSAPDAPVWGFADTHTHEFPNLASNGYKLRLVEAVQVGVGFVLPACVAPSCSKILVESQVEVAV
jgi:hypothetical protein